uniref:phospholipase A2 n=1 Tax=Equus caballus TaxID=9796 RepID=A0A9L0RQQ6_HORSE
MLWALWPRWLAGKGLPLLGAVLLRKREKREPQWRQWRRETHPYYDLQVKVLRARNIQGTDLLSKPDCYVQLWLPTASPSQAQTRMVANCRDPEWNETFHYRIHGAVKNVLELTLYDKDVLDSNQLCLLLFDLRSLKPGQPHRHTFLLNRQDSQELQVEFVLENSQVPASEVITNGVLVAQPCLRIEGTLGGAETAPHQEYADQGWNRLPLEVENFLSLEVFKHRGCISPTPALHKTPVKSQWQTTGSIHLAHTSGGQLGLHLSRPDLVGVSWLCSMCPSSTFCDQRSSLGMSFRHQQRHKRASPNEQVLF